MEEQLTDGAVQETTDHKPSIDPLRRVFVPIERVTPNGTTVFGTHDREVYVRLEDGSIRRARLKLRGKAARKAERRTRREEKCRKNLGS